MFSYRRELWQYDGRERAQIDVNTRNRDGELQVDIAGQAMNFASLDRGNARLKD
jgi:hypothetical protein